MFPLSTEYVLRDGLSINRYFAWNFSIRYYKSNLRGRAIWLYTYMMYKTDVGTLHTIRYWRRENATLYERVNSLATNL